MKLIRMLAAVVRMLHITRNTMAEQVIKRSSSSSGLKKHITVGISNITETNMQEQRINSSRRQLLPMISNNNNSSSRSSSRLKSTQLLKQLDLKILTKSHPTNKLVSAGIHACFRFRRLALI